MAFTSYSDLKTTVASYLGRSDLTSVIPDFIGFAELRIARDLRTRQMLQSATANTVSTIVARDSSGNFSAGTITAALTGTASKATNIVGGLAGSIPYNTSADTTTLLAIGSATTFLKSTGTAPSWVSAKVKAGLPPSKQESQGLNAYLQGARQADRRGGARPHRARHEHPAHVRRERR